MKCPIMSNRYSYGTVECFDDCAWRIGGECVAIYIGAYCKLGIINSQYAEPKEDGARFSDLFGILRDEGDR